MEKKLHSDYAPGWGLSGGYLQEWDEYEMGEKQWWHCRCLTKNRSGGRITSKIFCDKREPVVKGRHGMIGYVMNGELREQEVEDRGLMREQSYN